MNVKRTAWFAIGGGALLAWLAGAATSNHEIAAPPPTRTAPIEARGAELASEIARLHERLRPSAMPRQPARNLFTFHATPAPALPLPLAPAAPAAVPAALGEPAPSPPAQPSLKLAGIAEDAGPDGPVRLAFISGEGQLFMVKEGDAVTARYQVVRISADVVELIDQGDHSTRRLALR